MSADQAERVPDRRVARITAKRLFEPGLRELRFSPACRPKPAGLRAAGIVRRDARGLVVVAQGLVVAMSDLEGTPELEPRKRAVGRKSGSKFGRSTLGGPEIADGGFEPDQELPRRDGIGMFLDGALEQRDRRPLLPFVREQGRLLYRSRTRDAGGERQKDRPRWPKPSDISTRRAPRVRLPAGRARKHARDGRLYEPSRRRT